MVVEYGEGAAEDCVVGLAKSEVDGEKGVNDGEDEDVEPGFEKCPDRASFATGGSFVRLREVRLQEIFAFLRAESLATFLGITAVYFGFAGEDHDE